MTKVSFIIPKYTDELSQTLTNLYDEGGQDAIFAYVNEHHKNWDWDYCIPCEYDSPVYKYDAFRICAVCFSDLDFNNNNQ